MYMGMGNPRGRWPERPRPHPSTTRCPRCGRMMATHTVLLECPGCKYTVPVPPPAMRRSRPPADNLLHRIRDSLAESFQRRYAAPDYTPTYFWKDWSLELSTIMVVGALGCLLQLHWGELFSELGMAGLGTGFRVCWVAYLLNIPLQLMVVLHNSRLAKDVGVAWMVIMIAVSAAAYSQVPGSYILLVAGENAGATDLAAAQLAFKASYLGVPYFAWVGWYLLREKR